MSHPRSLTEKARSLLEEDLLAGRLRPGDRVSESKLSERYRIGRMPLREAIHQLQALELLEQVPRYGTVVHRPERGEIVSLFELLEAIEGQAAALAARRISEEDLATLRQLNEHFDHWLADQSGEKKDPVPQVSVSEYASIDLAFHRILARGSANHRIFQWGDQLRLVARVMESRHRRFLLEELTLSRAHHRWIVRALESRDAESARNWSAKHVAQQLRHVLHALDHRKPTDSTRYRFDLPEDVLREISNLSHRCAW